LSTWADDGEPRGEGENGSHEVHPQRVIVVDEGRERGGVLAGDAVALR